MFTRDRPYQFYKACHGCVAFIDSPNGHASGYAQVGSLVIFAEYFSSDADRSYMLMSVQLEGRELAAMKATLGNAQWTKFPENEEDNMLLYLTLA
jgi:hypothetical protein